MERPAPYYAIAMCRRFVAFWALTVAAWLAAPLICDAQSTNPDEGLSSAPWLRSYIDWDAYQANTVSALAPLRMSTLPGPDASLTTLGDTLSPAAFGTETVAGHDGTAGSNYTWQFLPAGTMYSSYLAGVKEPRLQTNITWDSSGKWYWEPTLGGRVALLRFGDNDIYHPHGFEIAAEGAAIARLNGSDNVDFTGVDFRGGVPLAFSWGNHVTKLAYYHMSAHVGDEFLIKHPGFQRLNWARDAFVLGHSVYLTDDLRIYGEAGWAFYTDVSKEWEFQFGIEYAPVYATSIRGAPFFALNAHLREEVQFGGNLTAQAGWAWRSAATAELFRLGVQYYNGKSSQNSFFNQFEQQVSFGIWYDF